ncbi:MAG: septum formation initiator family protein [Treponema sp.]|nr:septum formation initiator family protein [Treponema sp.]
MRLLRYMLVPWTFLLVYTFFSFFLGQNGLYARRHLEAEYLRLLENRNALEATNRNFLRTKENLLNDDDALSVYARQLGFGNPGEEFIRVVGLGVAANVNVPSGQVLYSTPPHYIPNARIRIISMFFGIAVLVFFLIHDFYWLREMDDG